MLLEFVPQQRKFFNSFRWAAVIDKLRYGEMTRTVAKSLAKMTEAIDAIRAYQMGLLKP